LESLINDFWVEVFTQAEVYITTAPDLILERVARKSETSAQDRQIRKLLAECGVEGEAEIKKGEGNSFIVCIKNELYCRVGNKTHSCPGKTYYSVDLERSRVFPKCFACKNDSVPPLRPPWGDLQQDALDYDTPSFVREYVRLVAGRIKMVSACDNKCYIFNAVSALWEHKSHQFAENLVASLLQPIVKKFMIPGKGGEKQKRAFIKFIGSTHGQRSVFLQARTEFEDALFKTNLIAHLLPIRNARVVDLRTGNVRARTAEDFFSFQCDVEFDGNLQRATPHADKFFSDVFRESYNYMRRQLGYCLTGEMVARAFFIWWGRGANGKGACSDILKRVLGEFYTTLQPKAVMSWKDSANGPSNASPHLVALASARVAMVSETGPNDSNNVNFEKAWTGRD
jgi:hypothetical protein